MRRGLALVLVAAGCSGGGGVKWEGSVETLANGGVRVSNPATGAWLEGRGWRPVPELAIGEAEGTEALTFGNVSAVLVGDDGRIYVLDRQTNDLRIFDARGQHVRTVGREGAGPGEYRAANGMLWLAPDSLLVVDQRGNRYSVLTAEGEYVRSVPRSLGFYAWAFQGGLYDGRVWEQSWVGATVDVRQPALLGTDLYGTAGVDTLLLPEPAGESPGFYSVQTARGGMTMSVPHAASPTYLLDTDGALWFGHGSEYRIVKARLAGDTLLEILNAATAAAVTTEEIAEFERSEGVKRFRDMGGQLDLGRIPKSKPYFDRFIRDDEGYLWAWVPLSESATAFDVFDGEGRFMGRLTLPDLRRSQYIGPVVKNGRLYIVGRDELDVQRVFVYRIERPDGARTAGT